MCLRADCIQEESRLAARDNGKSSTNEEIHVLAAQSSKKKGFFKRNRDKRSDGAPGSKKKKDLSHLECFKCDKFGHYAKDCPTKPKQQASIADVGEISLQKDSSGFLFYSTLSSNVPTDNNTWLIDSGASHHSTGFREHLSNLVERDSSVQIIIGDDACYFVKGVGTSTLHLDSSISLQLSDVLFVPGIKRNLVSISASEDKGYQVAFSKCKVLAWPKNSSIKIA